MENYIYVPLFGNKTYPYGLREVAKRTGLRFEMLDGGTTRYGEELGVFMTDTWVVSSLRRDTMRIRDEGRKAVEEKRDNDGNVLEQAVPARRRWPEGCYVVIKSQVASGDQEVITHELYQSKLVNDQKGQAATDTRFMVERASIAAAAAMVVGFEGPIFMDPDTGKMLEMKGDFQNRLNTVRRLPPDVSDFIREEVNKLDESPLELTSEETDSESESEPLSMES